MYPSKGAEEEVRTNLVIGNSSAINIAIDSSHFERRRFPVLISHRMDVIVPIVKDDWLLFLLVLGYRFKERQLNGEEEEEEEEKRMPLGPKIWQAAKDSGPLALKRAW